MSDTDRGPLLAMQQALAGALTAAGVRVFDEPPVRTGRDPAGLPIVAFGDCSYEYQSPGLWDIEYELLIVTRPLGGKADAGALMRDVEQAFESQALTPTAGYALTDSAASLIRSGSIERADEGHWIGRMAIGGSIERS